MHWRALVLVSVAGAGMLMTVIPATAEAAAPAPLRAGYVATVNASHTVNVAVVAPNLQCPAKGRRAVAVGAFGTVTETYKRKTSTHAWAAIVRTVCNDGKKSSTARYTNHVSTSGSMRVTAGDRVVLVVSNQGQQFSMSDGQRGEGGAGPLLPGQQFTMNSKVLFGAEVSAPYLPWTPVRLLRVHNGRTPLTALHPTLRVARRDQRIVIRPTAIQPNSGAFRVRHG